MPVSDYRHPASNAVGEWMMWLSAVIAVLMAAQSVSGLLVHDLYRDGAWVTAALRGNDLVTLIVAAPLLIASIIQTRRGSRRARLVWLGMLFYAFYNYAFYLLGSVVNSFFIVYAFLLTLSAISLVGGFFALDLDATKAMFGSKTPVRSAAGFLLAVAILIGSMWIALWLKSMFTGALPEVGGSEPVYRLIAALDLSVQVPALAVGGVLLWRRQRWGYPLAVMLVTANSVYMLVLFMFSPFAASSGVADAWVQAPLWVVLGAGFLVSSALLLANVTTSPGSVTPPQRQG